LFNCVGNEKAGIYHMLDKMLMSASHDFWHILDVVVAPVFIKDAQCRYIFVNAAFAILVGVEREKLLQADGREVYLDSEFDSFHRTDQYVFESGEAVEVEAQLTNVHNETRTFLVRKVPVRVDGTQVLVGVLQDITAFRKAEAYNRFLAFHDALTGLPNRTFLFDLIERALTLPTVVGRSTALLILDLDHFKQFNVTHGPLAGDALIREFAQRVTAVVRAQDTVARLGGDEFAIFLENADSSDEVEVICRRIATASSKSFNVIGTHAHIFASIGGVIMAAGAGITLGELLRKANIALRRAKADGRGCHRFYDDSMDGGYKDRLEIEHDLMQALRNGKELTVAYQPTVCNRGEMLIGVEALVRWNHPRLGPLSPVQFIPMAEESDLIFELGDWVLRQACLALRTLVGLSLAVNVSPIQLRDPNLADRIFEILEQSKFDATRLELEITESAILNASTVAKETLRRLRKQGIRIALDDFGTGYSSLDHLNQLEIDKIKIDRSFIMRMVQSAAAAAIVQAITQLGRTLNLAITAEGVETREQRDYLATTSCTELQGFLFSRPMSALELTGFVHSYTAKQCRHGGDQ
jgi:diguanylate cyclase (GGDEF)-like protein/PAS domain S-box-containing protein